MRRLDTAHLIANSPGLVAQVPGIVFDLLGGLVVLAVLLALALTAAMDTFPKVRLVEPMSLLGPLKRVAVVEYGVTGRWPDTAGIAAADGLAPDLNGFGIAGLDVRNGSIHLMVDAARALRGKAPAADFPAPVATLSLIRAAPAGGESHFAIWVCGHAAPPPGLARLGEPNRTDIPRRYLPPVCRI